MGGVGWADRPRHRAGTRFPVVRNLEAERLDPTELRERRVTGPESFKLIPTQRPPFALPAEQTEALRSERIDLFRDGHRAEQGLQPRRQPFGDDVLRPPRSADQAGVLTDQARVGGVADLRARRPLPGHGVGGAGRAAPRYAGFIVRIQRSEEI